MRHNWIGLLFVLVTAITCTSQAASTTKKSSSRKQPGGRSSSFVCPEPEAKKACKSYEELVKAKDAGLLNGAYVCFRRNTDEFFVVWFAKPYFQKKWDSDLKQMVTDPEATYRGLGTASSYKNGVADGSVMPSLYFSGTWMAFGEAGMFSSEKINGKKKEENEAGVVIEESQVNATYRYQNTLGQTVEYNLTIQRSTGRFSESYREESAKASALENAGRCVYRK